MKLGVIFGGKCEEHDVSCMSATSLMDAARSVGFEVVPIAIGRDGAWYVGDDAGAVVGGRAAEGRLTPEAAVAAIRRAGVETIFPITHGRGGEDGTLQGFLETCGLPFVGSRTLGSAICMDKVLQKLACKAAGIPVVKFVWGDRDGWHVGKGWLERAVKGFGPPYFVKPSNQGSSVGVTKVKDPKFLAEAVEHALAHDDRFLVEEGIEGAKELDIGLLETARGLEFSEIGEIRPNAEFYDYKAKYEDETELVVPARIGKRSKELIESIAESAWKHLSCRGLARMEFLLDPSGEPYLLEVNTLPGFTSHSIYPRLFAAKGKGFGEVVKELVEGASAAPAGRE